jgi:hypothetical protein
MFRTFSMIAGLAIGLSCAQTPRPEKPWTVTTAPLWLLGMAPNAGVEYRPRPELGVAVRAGFNPRREDPYQMLTGELRSYHRGAGPHAMMLGVEALWSRIDDTGQGPENVQHILGLGPILGYRFEHRTGLTASVHAGPALFADKNTGADWEFMPWFLLGADVGWSF